MILIKKILIITGQNSYPIIENIIKGIKSYNIEIFKAPITISAFLSESLTENILNEIDNLDYDLILLPGFIQWDTSNLEAKFSLNIKKGPEFASDLPYILKNLESIKLSSSANSIIEWNRCLIFF